MKAITISIWKKAALLSLLVTLAGMGQVTAETMALEKVVQTALRNSLPLQIATLQAERSTHEADKLHSMLGWQQNARLNFNHDVGFTGTPSNKLNAMGGMSRKLSNGDVIGGSASYSMEDSEFVFGPAFPNPAHRINLDVNYRKSLQKGVDNPLYNNGLKKAEVGVVLSEESRLLLQDNFTIQVVESYFASLLTQASMNNIQRAIERTSRLIKFIKKNRKLGLAEEKDLLQVNAQLQSLKADQSSLQLAWLQQTSNLNRLMGKGYQDDFLPILKKTFPRYSDVKLILDESLAYSPGIRLQQAKIKLAESVMDDVKNNKKNQLDLVMSVGTRTAYGENSLNSTVNETDYALMVGVEYSRAADKRGVNAELQQAMLDRSIALREIENIKQELNYSVMGLLQEIDATDSAIKQYDQRVNREMQKLAEAEARYERGRTTTQELIMFENDLSIAKFLLEQKRIDLARRHARLVLLQKGATAFASNKGGL